MFINKKASVCARWMGNICASVFVSAGSVKIAQEVGHFDRVRSQVPM